MHAHVLCVPYSICCSKTTPLFLHILINFPGQEACALEEDLSNSQLGRVVHMALTLIQLYSHQNEGVEHEAALAIAADVDRQSVETVRAWERDFVSSGRITPPAKSCVCLVVRGLIPRDSSAGDQAIMLVPGRRFWD